jgi:hypothetical protein
VLYVHNNNAFTWFLFIIIFSADLSNSYKEFASNTVLENVRPIETDVMEPYMLGKFK